MKYVTILSCPERFRLEVLTELRGVVSEDRKGTDCAQVRYLAKR